MRAIAIYESLFSDPITIHIFFRYSTGGPAPSPALPPPPAPAPPRPERVPERHSLSARGCRIKSFRPFTRYRGTISSAHLRADATTSNDNKAIASLPGSPLSTNIAPSSANGRAVGLNTPAGHALRRHHWTGRTVMMESLRLIPRNHSRSPGLSSVAASTRSVRLSMKLMRLWVLDRT